MRLDAWTLAGVAVAALDVVTILRAISRERGVERTLAWIFAILAFPAVGALAYLAFASPSIRRTTRRKATRAMAARLALGEGFLSQGHDFADAAPIFRLAERVTGLPPTRANRVSLMTRNEHAFERIRAALRSARRRIWVEYYIVRDDGTGHRFLDALAERARAGIEVRFVYDAVGSIGLDSGRLQVLREAGGRTASFLPFNPLRRRWSVQLRNHRKLIVVDDRLAFTGGMNIGDEYSGRLRRRRGVPRHFRDAHLEIEGPAVACLAEVFVEDWAFAADETLELAIDLAPVPGGTAIVGALPSGPDQRHNATWMTYFTAISVARERVWLATPYFVPDAGVEAALLSAALRGVDVRVVVPAVSDVRVAEAASRSYCRALAQAGVRVFRYLPRMLHSKTLLVDEELCFVGSANSDIRSFRLNFELGALVHDPLLARQVESAFEDDFAQSSELTAAEARATPFGERLRDGAARLLSPML